MPIGAFISSQSYMASLQNHPKLGHITTFGGHPVIAAAGLATLTEVLETSIMTEVTNKEKLIRKLLVHPLIEEIRGKGLMLAVLVNTPEIATQIILQSLEKGLILFWLLFEGKAIRITPPLTINNQEIEKACDILIEVMDNVFTNCDYLAWNGESVHGVRKKNKE